jgi:hypothetical protein
MSRRTGRIGGTRIKSVLLAVGMLASVPVSAEADTDLGESGGFFYVMDSVTSSDHYPVDATCPTGTHVAGGGWANTFVTGSQPIDGPDANRTPDDGWKVGAYQGSPFASDAYAICTTRQSTYVKGRRKELAVGQTRTAKAKCPAGTQVISGGGVLQGLNANSSRLHSSFPFDGRDPDLSRDDGWAVTAPSLSQPGRLRAYAVCGDSLPSYTELSGMLPPNGSIAPIPACPASHHVVGVGLQSFGPADAGYIDVLKPVDASAGPNSDADVVPDDSGHTNVTNSSGFSDPFTAIAICLE